MRIYFKITSLLFLFFIILSLNSCRLRDYEDTLHLIPADGEIIVNININAYFKEKGLIEKIGAARELRSLKKFLESLEDVAGAITISAFSDSGIDFKKELFPCLKPNFSAAFYDTGGVVAEKIFKEKSPEDKEKALPFITVFNIDDSDGIDRFLKKLAGKIPFEKQEYRGKEVYYSPALCYFKDEDFLIFSDKINLIEKSLDCRDSSIKSINEEKGFISFKEKSLNSDSTGFIYYNISRSEEAFLKALPESCRDRWKELSDSLEYMGTSIELSSHRLELKTYLVHGANLKPFAKDFFSINSRKLKSLTLFPDSVSGSISLSEPDRVFPLIFSLFEGAPFMEKIKGKAENTLPVGLSSIIASLKDEFTIGFYPEEGGKDLSKNSGIALKLKEDSFLGNMLQSSDILFSLFSVINQPEVYRDITITNVPGGSAIYAEIGDFLFFDTGDNVKYTIDTFYGDKTSLEKHLNSELSMESVGILYVKSSEIYEKYLFHTVENKELKENLKEFFKSYPEVYGNIEKRKNGYLFNVITPF